MDVLSRRRFTAGAASVCLLPLGLEGCGPSDGSGSDVQVLPQTSLPSAVTPLPATTPTPVPSPTSSKALTIAFVGSSSPEQYLTLYNGGLTRPDVLVSTDGTSFVPLAQGAFGKKAGVDIVTATGRPVQFIRGGVGGSTLASWADAGSTYRAAMVRSIKAAGGADAVLIQVGRNDAANRIVGDLAAQVARLRSLIALLRQETGVAELQVFVGGSQDLLAADSEQYKMLGTQRQAEGLVSNEDAGVRYGFATYDLATVDGIHQNEASQIISGARFAAQVIAWLKGKAQSRGPRLSDARAINPTQTEVTLNLGSGTDVQPASGIDGFRLETSSGAHMINYAERISPAVVRLTHTPTDGQPAMLSYALFGATDDARCLRSNDELSLPMEPSYQIAPVRAV